MMIKLSNKILKKNKICNYIDAASTTAPSLSLLFCISEVSVYKSNVIDNFQGALHTEYKLQTFHISAKESIVVALFKAPLLPLGNFQADIRKFLSGQATSAGLYRLSRRHEGSNFNLLKPKKPSEPHKAFKSNAPCSIYINVKSLPQMPNETGRCYLFVVIERATRWVFILIKRLKATTAVRAFPNAFQKPCPINITIIFTHTDKKLIKRLFSSCDNQAMDKYEFDQRCQAFNIEQSLTKRRTAPTNGMVKPLNGRITDALKTYRFNRSEDVVQTLKQYVCSSVESSVTQVGTLVQKQRQRKSCRLHSSTCVRRNLTTINHIN